MKAQSAHVSSSEAVEAFRARLIVYRDKVKPLLADAADESQAERTLRRFEAQVVQADAPLAHCAGDGAYALVTDVPVAQPPATDAPVRPLVTK